MSKPTVSCRKNLELVIDLYINALRSFKEKGTGLLEDYHIALIDNSGYKTRN